MASGSARLGRPVLLLPPEGVPPVARLAGQSVCVWLQGGYVTRFIMLLVVASVVMWIRPSAAVAGTLQVCPNGCPFTSIQNAIDAAQTGDKITIARGTYTENLHILAPVAAKMLTLIGTGAPKTIVDGKQQDCVLEVETDYTVTITGMTFTNGKCLQAGGIVNHGTLTLTNVTVSHNEGEETAGGIANDVDSTLTLIRSSVNDNTSTDPITGQGGRPLQPRHGVVDQYHRERQQRPGGGRRHREPRPAAGNQEPHYQQHDPGPRGRARESQRRRGDAHRDVEQLPSQEQYGLYRGWPLQQWPPHPDCQPD